MDEHPHWILSAILWGFVAALLVGSLSLFRNAEDLTRQSIQAVHEMESNLGGEIKPLPELPPLSTETVRVRPQRRIEPVLILPQPVQRKQFAAPSVHLPVSRSHEITPLRIEVQPPTSGAAVPISLPKPPAIKEATVTPSQAFEQPQPIRRVLPDARFVLANSPVARDVQVTLEIDAEGNVASVHLPWSDLTPPAYRAIEDAARQWKFTPAQFRGKPVASEHVIVFRFRP